jgi:hypothetical protein
MRFSIIAIIVLLIFTCVGVLMLMPSTNINFNSKFILSNTSQITDASPPSTTISSPPKENDIVEAEVAETDYQQLVTEESSKQEENQQQQSNLDDWKKAEYLWRLASQQVSKNRREPFESRSPFEEARKMEKEAQKSPKKSRFVLSEKIHDSFVQPTTDQRLALIVIGTGEMRSYDRCGPRLRSSILQPNNALLTMFTFPDFLTQDYKNENYDKYFLPDYNSDFWGGNLSRLEKRKKEREMMHHHQQLAGSKSRKRGQKNQLKQSSSYLASGPMTRIPLHFPKFSFAKHHEKLREVYGEHLALSILLNSSRFVHLAQRVAPEVSFAHFHTVMAQWAVIEFAASWTMDFLTTNSSKSNSRMWFLSESNTKRHFVFLRIRPDVFVIGTRMLFSLTRKNNLKIEMSCGEEESSPLRSHAEKKYEFDLHRERFSRTFLRSTSFPEGEWPLDPLSDYSSIFVVEDLKQLKFKETKGDEQQEENKNDDEKSTSKIFRVGFRLWSWMMNQPDKPGHMLIQNYSYVSPEKITTNFTALSGLETEKVSFGWHFLLRQEMYNKVWRPNMRVEKFLKKFGKKVFRTHDSNQVKCPP